MKILNRKKTRIIIGFLLVLIVAAAAGAIWWIRSAIFPRAYQPLVREAAAKYDLDPLLVAAVVLVESKFDPDAVSPKNAVGLMQIMPGTAVDVAAMQKRKNFDITQLKKPHVNLDMGCFYLKRLLKRYRGDMALSLAAYHAGPRNVNKWLKQAGSQDIIKGQEIVAGFAFEVTAHYVENVIGKRKLLRLLY